MVTALSAVASVIFVCLSLSAEFGHGPKGDLCSTGLAVPGGGDFACPQSVAFPEPSLPNGWRSSIDQESGLLTLVGHEDIGGSIPRSFGITPEGDYLIVACQDTHTINTFKIDKETGKLTSTGSKAPCPSPVRIQFNWK